MPQCKKCSKKGLFLKIEEDSGLCLACNEVFATEGKPLTERIFAAKKKAALLEDPAEIGSQCREIVAAGDQLIELHQSYNLTPSQELLDLIDTYRQMGKLAEK
jgi:hypothetical protein